MVECPECGAGADLTPDGSQAHCASCNTIFEPGKEGSGEKGSGSGSGDKPDTSSNDEKVNHADEEVDHETKR
ncbi:hypothetical protein H2198_009692 [Neophaeococcomyces mojaviensis]|uniref:Uncharacterized protein n=1 Tax=Neophaeococcomyces mojaviensis TaxID=3383035 RepID=A0ACC2ZTV5_9EURO|nr:hypothetical protein H2198_009692 [Knufia sp. JES_112]